MLKAMFEQFISEYEIYPFTSHSDKETDRIRFICKSDITSICFAIVIDSAFPYRWKDVVDLVHRGILHIISIKVY